VMHEEWQNKRKRKRTHKGRSAKSVLSLRSKTSGDGKV
jgi:hypothetical protein